MNVVVGWRQRSDNYQRALRQLTQAAEPHQTRAPSELEQQGLTQGFEFTLELAWNLLRKETVIGLSTNSILLAACWMGPSALCGHAPWAQEA